MTTINNTIATVRGTVIVDGVATPTTVRFDVSYDDILGDDHYIVAVRHDLEPASGWCTFVDAIPGYTAAITGLEADTRAGIDALVASRIDAIRALDGFTVVGTMEDA